ncbi:hypothetical protein B0J18DRAFT_418630 [Chaetomium sp. MPI-SDFR-AT-0129]|nr:hypothetical protein B0J18DRAFT_418630 [Chaetomium sp. MPI-SDFR-AT-0129]
MMVGGCSPLVWVWLWDWGAYSLYVWNGNEMSESKYLAANLTCSANQHICYVCMLCMYMYPGTLEVLKSLFPVPLVSVRLFNVGWGSAIFAAGLRSPIPKRELPCAQRPCLQVPVRRMLMSVHLA